MTRIHRISWPKERGLQTTGIVVHVGDTSGALIIRPFMNCAGKTGDGALGIPINCLEDVIALLRYVAAGPLGQMALDVTVEEGKADGRTG